MKQALGAAFALAIATAFASPAAADIVHFIPGTYYLTNGGLHAPPNDTLVLTVSGGIANFVMTGADNVTFSVPDASVPTMVDNFGPNAYYNIPGSTITASWNTALYPWINFYGLNSGYGFDINSGSGNHPGAVYATTYESSKGSGKLFTLTSTPEPMTVALFGAGLAGAAAFRGRRAKR